MGDVLSFNRVIMHGLLFFLSLTLFQNLVKKAPQLFNIIRVIKRPWRVFPERNGILLPIEMVVLFESRIVI